jgi:hypothetical protein
MSKQPQQTPSASAGGQLQRPVATVRYIDRPEITETFADSITGVSYDGQTLRMEFAVTRLDDVKPNSPLTGRRYPTCRLVLSPGAALDLINRVQQITTALKQAGTLKANPAEPAKAG